MHGPEEKSAEIALKAGKHQITINYFNYWGDEGTLDVYFDSPVTEKQLISPGIIYTK